MVKNGRNKGVSFLIVDLENGICVACINSA